jgi:hypothetical protein
VEPAAPRSGVSLKVLHGFLVLFWLSWFVLRFFLVLIDFQWLGADDERDGPPYPDGSQETHLLQRLQDTSNDVVSSPREIKSLGPGIRIICVRCIVTS